jgi:tetratricopeptide (TPR) repeat protein
LSGSSSESELAVARPDPLTPTDREAVAEIVALVANSRTQGCVYFGICNNRLKIAALEALLAAELRVHGIETAQVVLAKRRDEQEQPVYQVLIADPIGYFAAHKPGKPGLFLVHGLPELIRIETAADGSAPAPVSQRLNYGRELFRREAICALFWIDPETTRYLAERARDFWSFRSGTAQFDAEPGEQNAPTEPRGEWQTGAPSSRWLGDLQEKLDQLAVYRSKSPPDESAIASVLLDVGRIRVERRELQPAFEALHEAEEILERLGNRRQLRMVKTWLFLGYQRAGRLDKAEEYIRAAIAIDSELEDEGSLAIDCNNLSQIYQARGELGEGEQWLRKAIAIAERLGNESGLGIAYNNLSQIYQDRGELDEAEQWLRKAIAIAERLGNEPNLAIRYNNLSQIYKARGELGAAEQWLRKAIAIDERLGDEPSLAIDYNNLSQIYKARGELGAAEQWLRKAIAIAERLGNESGLGIAYNNLSLIYKARGELDEAEQWLRKAIAIAERLGNEPNLAIDYNNLSQIYKARGELGEAEQWLRRALALAETKGNAAALATVRANLQSLAAEQQAKN